MAGSDSVSGTMALIPSKSDVDVEESNLFNNFCDELVAEIILRLPTTTAVRSQVICKRWYSIISSPYFISRFNHLRQSSLVFHVKSQNELHMISYGDLLSNPYRYKLEGSFADLILCSAFNNETKYYVSNLLTKQRIALPQPSTGNGFDEVSTGFLCVLPPCSDCKPVYNTHHKFVVVRLRTVPCPGFQVQVFSSEDFQWRTWDVSSPRPRYQHDIITTLVAYRGMLHWLNRDCIVVYDPLNTPKKFSCIISLPIQLPMHKSLWKTSCFGVCQDCLRVVELSGEDAGDLVVDVWVLEDYGSGLWNLVHKVYLSDLTYNGLPIAEGSLQNKLGVTFVLSLHPKNGDIVYLRIGSGVALVNMKSRIIERYYPYHHYYTKCIDGSDGISTRRCEIRYQLHISQTRLRLKGKKNKQLQNYDDIQEYINDLFGDVFCSCVFLVVLILKYLDVCFFNFLFDTPVILTTFCLN